MLAIAHILSVWMGWREDVEQGIAIALAESECAIQLDPSDSWAYVGLGLSYGLRRDNASAIAELNKAIEIDQNLALARYMLGAMKVWGGDGDDGIVELDMYVRSNPRDPFNRIVGGMYSAAHFVAGRYEDAVAAAREAVRKMPKSAGPVRILAAAYALNGQETDAASAFEVLKRLQPNISTAWVRHYFPWTDGEHMDRFVHALELAGME